MIKLAILTSSRADFGIYLPLLKKLGDDPGFNFELVVFGTHLSKAHGYSLDQIRESGFNAHHTLQTLKQTHDAPGDISRNMAHTLETFAGFWESHRDSFDHVLVLGDRWEMFSAVMAGVPFGIPFAHLHGGETSLGAIDEVFRHGISLASKQHFVSHPDHASRLQNLLGHAQNIHMVGALSLDTLQDFRPLSPEQFRGRYGIEISSRTVLTTFHAESANPGQIQEQVKEFCTAILDCREFKFLISMPGADTLSGHIRQAYKDFLAKQDHVHLVENLGTEGYFSAMHHCAMVLGNSSSGIIEAASFRKWALNLGERQKGRSHSANLIQVPLQKDKIVEEIRRTAERGPFTGPNKFWNQGAADKIIAALKQKA